MKEIKLLAKFLEDNLVLWTPIGKIRKMKCGGYNKEVLCVCHCGIQKWIPVGNLKSLKSKSCHACSMRKHGGAYTRLHLIWRMMRQRCNNPKAAGYANYGGRGIQVCAEWSEFTAFRNWALANGYTDLLTIDRKNVHGMYQPDNCAWATSAVQARNKRNNVRLTRDGKTLCITDWAKRISGVSEQAMRQRKRKGYSVKEIMAPRKTVSKYRGVTFRKGRVIAPWRARITADGVLIHLGDFYTELEAAKAYNEAAQRLHGKRAALNKFIQLRKRGKS